MLAFYERTKARQCSIGRLADGKSDHSLDHHPHAITLPGIVILRFDGPLFFATANSLRMRIKDLTLNEDLAVKTIILDMESTNIVDLQGSDVLREIGKALKELHVDFYLTRVKASILQILTKAGVLEEIPGDHFYHSIGSLLEAIQK